MQRRRAGEGFFGSGRRSCSHDAGTSWQTADAPGAEKTRWADPTAFSNGLSGADGGHSNLTLRLRQFYEGPPHGVWQNMLRLHRPASVGADRPMPPAPSLGTKHHEPRERWQNRRARCLFPMSFRRGLSGPVQHRLQHMQGSCRDIRTTRQTFQERTKPGGSNSPRVRTSGRGRDHAQGGRTAHHRTRSTEILARVIGVSLADRGRISANFRFGP